MAKVRACNSVNLKPGGIIEQLLKVVNILCMCSGLGVVQSNQPARYTGDEASYGGVRLVGAFIVFGEVSKKVLCA